MKPKHQGGYTELHAELCERTLVTLLRGLGPWKAGVYLAGGLVPRYLIPRPSGGSDGPPPHAGPTDVDLVLDVEMLATVEADAPSPRFSTAGTPPTHRSYHASETTLLRSAQPASASAFRHSRLGLLRERHAQRHAAEP